MHRTRVHMVTSRLYTDGPSVFMTCVLFLCPLPGLCCVYSKDVCLSVLTVATEGAWLCCPHLSGSRISDVSYIRQDKLVADILFSCPSVWTALPLSFTKGQLLPPLPPDFRAARPCLTPFLIFFPHVHLMQLHGEWQWFWGFENTQHMDKHFCFFSAWLVFLYL